MTTSLSPTWEIHNKVIYLLLGQRPYISQKAYIVHMLSVYCFPQLVENMLKEFFFKSIHNVTTLKTAHVKKIAVRFLTHPHRLGHTLAFSCVTLINLPESVWAFFLRCVRCRNGKVTWQALLSRRSQGVFPTLWLDSLLQNTWAYYFLTFYYIFHSSIIYHL